MLFKTTDLKNSEFNLYQQVMGKIDDVNQFLFKWGFI